MARDLSKGTATVPDPDESSMGEAMRACTPAERRFAMAAVLFPLAKDWQIAKAAGLSDKSHGYLRKAACQLFHSERVLSAIKECADKEIRGSAMLGIATMKKIARLDGHKDQLKAAAGLVGLAGFTVEQKISVQQTTRDLTGDAILRKIRELADRLGVDAGKLLSGPQIMDAEFSEVQQGESE